MKIQHFSETGACAEAKTSSEHVNALDFIKICATFAIIFHHYQQFTGVRFSHINFFGGIFDFHSMVYLFFMISGFFVEKYIDRIMMHTEGFQSFLKKRAYRLLPMTALTAVVYELVLVLFIVVSGTSFNDWVGDRGIARNYSLLGFGVLMTMAGTGAGWFWNGKMANGVTWYVCVLLLCYVVFFICCRLAAYFGISENYFFVVMIMIGIGCRSYGVQLPFFNENSCEGYIPFFIGVLLGKFMKKRNHTARGVVLAAGLAGIVVSVLYIVTVAYVIGMGFPDSYWLMFVTFPSLIIICLSEPIKKIFKSRIWCTWGGYYI